NGIYYKENVFINYDFFQIHSLELFFRTNCHVLNRLDECCAHDFKFVGCYSLRGGKQVCEAINGSSCLRENSWISSDYTEGTPSFNFAMFNPAEKKSFINLTDLLLNATKYKNWFNMEKCHDYSSFQSTRSCIKNNMVIRLPPPKCGKNEILNILCRTDPFEEMEIC
ncbi:hypothetical protein Mgra_00007875, partial [Meloidogyne graminicola]